MQKKKLWQQKRKQVEVELVELKLRPLKQELQAAETEDMSVEANSRLNVKIVVRTKRLLKILPMLTAGLFFINTLLSTFGIDYRIFSYLASVGIIPWMFIMAASYMFRFCAYHRMFLWYVLANNIVCWADAEFGLPISNWNLLVLHFILWGITLFLVLYFWLRCKDRNLKQS